MEKLTNYARKLKYVPKHIRKDAKESGIKIFVLDDLKFDRRTSWHNVVLISHRVAVQVTPKKVILINKDHIPKQTKTLYHNDLRQGIELVKQLKG